jgi:hypothetical protein
MYDFMLKKTIAILGLFLSLGCSKKVTDLKPGVIYQYENGRWVEFKGDTTHLIWFGKTF